MRLIHASFKKYYEFCQRNTKFYFFVLVFITDLLWHCSEMFPPWEKNDENKNWKSILKYFVLKVESIEGLKYFDLQRKADVKITGDLDENTKYLNFWTLKKAGNNYFSSFSGVQRECLVSNKSNGCNLNSLSKILEQNKPSCAYYWTTERHWGTLFFFIPSLMIKVFLMLEFVEKQKNPNTRHLMDCGFLIATTKNLVLHLENEFILSN